jgi:hypothetical protein
MRETAAYARAVRCRCHDLSICSGAGQACLAANLPWQQAELAGQPCTTRHAAVLPFTGPRGQARRAASSSLPRRAGYGARAVLRIAKLLETLGASPLVMKQFKRCLRLNLAGCLGAARRRAANRLETMPHSFKQQVGREGRRGPWGDQQPCTSGRRSTCTCGKPACPNGSASGVAGLFHAVGCVCRWIDQISAPLCAPPGVPITAATISRPGYNIRLSSTRCSWQCLAASP